MNYLPRINNPALRQGIVFGLVLAVVEVVFSYVGGYLGSALLIDLVAIALYVGFGYLAGRRAVASTGRLGTAILAGFLTGLIGILVPSIILLIVTLFNLDSIRQMLQQQAPKGSAPITNGDILLSIALNTLQNLLLPVILTLGGGALAGYLARKNPRITEQEQAQEEESASLPPTPTPGQ